MKILVNIFKSIFWLIMLIFTIAYTIGNFVITIFERGVGDPLGMMVYESIFTRYKDRYFS